MLDKRLNKACNDDDQLMVVKFLFQGIRIKV